MKNLKRIISLSIVVLFVCISTVFATNPSKIDEYIKENNLSANTITASQIITMYQDLSKEYSNEEIAQMLDEYSGTIEEGGIAKEAISTGKKILTTTDSETLNQILEDVNVEDIKQKLDNGATAEEVVNDIKDTMTTTQKISVVRKFIFGNKTLKLIVCIWIGLIIYLVIIRGIIYKKAGRNFVTTFIPFYRDIVLFKICGYSAWWILLLLLPVIGWIIYGIFKIVMNFELSNAFGKSVLFGFGIWLLRPIFESIIAFSSNADYIEIEE